MKFRRWRDDDDAREDEARTMVTVSWSGAARNGIGKRPEELRTPVRCEDDRVDVRLREKGKGGAQWVRKDKGRRADHKVVARTHWVAGGELDTAATTSNSGEGSWAARCARERGK